tara:strand:+ start:503 stop:709 length:207 start_codon:yes stop_codon:yes gene_type:complete
MNKFDVMVIGLSIAFAFMFVRLVILRYEFKIWNRIFGTKYSLTIFIVAFIVSGIHKLYSYKEKSKANH